MEGAGEMQAGRKVSRMQEERRGEIRFWDAAVVLKTTTKSSTPPRTISYVKNPSDSARP